MKEITLNKVKEVIESVAQGNALTYCLLMKNLSDGSFYKALKEDEALKDAYDVARGLNQKILYNKVFNSKDTKCHLALLEKVHWKDFGKHVDRKSPKIFDEEEKQALLSDETTTQEKLKIYQKALIDDRISEDSFRLLCQAAREQEALLNNNSHDSIILATIDAPTNFRDKKERDDDSNC